MTENFGFLADEKRYSYELPKLFVIFSQLNAAHLFSNSFAKRFEFIIFVKEFLGNE